MVINAKGILARRAMRPRLGRRDDKGERYYDRRRNYFWLDVRYLTGTRAPRPRIPAPLCMRNAGETLVPHRDSSQKKGIKKEEGERVNEENKENDTRVAVFRNTDCVSARD